MVGPFLVLARRDWGEGIEQVEASVGGELQGETSGTVGSGWRHSEDTSKKFTKDSLDDIVI